MSHEILYTSAPKGLKPGSYGFCTVLATDGISKNLQDRLESLSGYEHAFALTDRRANLNPINYSHLIITVANQRLHLLSRVADAGADYSGRSNKLAHHVALLPNELTSSGPGGALTSPGFCKSSFEGEPRVLPTATPLPTTSHGPVPCNSWRDAVGDAGWAGVLAEMTIKYPSRPTTLIFEAGTNMLPLVEEALSLLPIDRQWHTTFSTFFTKLPAGIDCQWRFILNGTPAADTARRNLQAPPIDLTARPIVPSEGELVTAARTGKFAVAKSAAIPIVPIAPAPASASRPSATAATPTAGQQPPAVQSTGHGTYPLGSSPQTLPSTPVRSRYADYNPSTDRPSSRYGLLGAIAAGVIVLVVLIGVWSSSNPTHKSVDSVDPVTNPGQGTTPATPARKKPEERPAGLQTKMDEQPTAKPLDVKPIEVAVVPLPKSTEPPKVVEIPEKPLPPVFSDIKAYGKMLSLPKRDGGLSQTTSKLGELCKLFVKDAADCDLKLKTTDKTKDRQPLFYLQLDESAPKGTQVWLVNARPEKEALGGPASAAPIGKFRLHEQSLKFEWNLSPAPWSKPDGLTLCTLDVTVKGETVTCKLINPQRRKPERFNLAKGKQPMDLDVPPKSLQDPAFLKLDLELLFGDWSAQETLSAVSGTATKFVIPRESSHGKGDVDFEIRLQPPSEGEPAKLKYEAFPHLTFLKPIEAKGPKELPHWEYTTVRTDVFKPVVSASERPYKDGFIIPDFQRLQKFASGQKKTATEGPINTASGKITSIKEKMAFLESEREAARKKQLPEKVREFGEDIQKAQSELEYWEGMKDHWQELVKYHKDISAWITEMKAHFETLQKDLEVRFSVYLEFDDERVVLSETDPPPQRMASKVGKRQTETAKSKDSSTTEK